MSFRLLSSLLNLNLFSTHPSDPRAPRDSFTAGLENTVTLPSKSTSKSLQSKASPRTTSSSTRYTKGGRMLSFEDDSPPSSPKGYKSPRRRLHPPPRRVFDAFPDEVLYMIFLQLVLDDFERAYGCDFDTSPRAPWNIVAVSRSWSRVCRAHAKLWSHIPIGWHHCGDHMDVGSGGYDSAAVVRTSLQLERSKKTVLHIDARYSCKCPCTLSMLRAVGRECHRWEWANFDRRWQETHTIQDFIQPSSKTPLLKTLVWNVLNTLDEGVFTCPFTELVSLRSVHLSFLSSVHPDTIFPWSQLTYLNLDEYMGSLDHFLDILSECKSLITLIFNVDMNLFDIESEFSITQHNPDSITLPHLTSLNIEYCYLAPVIFLPCIRLPNLRKLTYEQRSFPPKVLSSLIDRSKAYSITELEVRVVDGTPDLPYLAKMPELVSLDISDCDYGYTDWRGRDSDEGRAFDKILGSLTMATDEGSSAGAGGWCPRLRHLKLEAIEFDPMLMVNMIKSRQSSTSTAPAMDIAEAETRPEGVAPLRSLTLDLLDRKEERRLGFYSGVLKGCLKEEVASEGLQLRFAGHLSGC